MIDAASAEFGAHPICGGQTKVCDGKAKTVLEAQDVLRLEIAMINIE